MMRTELEQAKIDQLRRLIEEGIDLLDRLGPEADQAKELRYGLMRDHLRHAIRELDRGLSERPRG